MHALFAINDPASQSPTIERFVRQLAPELRFAEVEVTIVSPYASFQNDSQLAERLNTLSVETTSGEQKVRVLEGRTQQSIRHFFLSNGRYLDSAQTDPHLRAAFFSKAVCEFVLSLSSTIDIIHCNDWQSALVPVFLEECYAEVDALAPVMVLTTIHDPRELGMCKPEILLEMCLPAHVCHPDNLGHEGAVSMLKGGILYSDGLSLLSESFVDEYLKDGGAFGLDESVQARQEDLFGVRIGVDYSGWDPKTDPLLTKNFDREYLNGKRQCKADLQRIAKLPIIPNVPLFLFCGELVEHKGLDLVSDVLDDLMDAGAQLIIAGSGAPEYETAAQAWAGEFPKQVSVFDKVDTALTHRALSGADILLLPSRWEVFEDLHLFAMKYGTIPCAHAIGPYKDDLEAVDDLGKQGTAFLFEEYTPDDLYRALDEAVSLYAIQRQWRGLQSRAMMRSATWRNTAVAYKKLYEELL